MELQTRIGIGAGAVFALVTYLGPHLGWLISGPLLFVCGVVAVWGVWPVLRALLPSRKAISSYWNGTAKKHATILGVLLFGIGIGGLLSSGAPLLGFARVQGPITWDFEQTSRGYGYFLAMVKGADDQQIRVLGVQAHGKNTSKDPIADFSGYLRADLTNEQLPIFVLAQDNDEAKIPACAPRIPTSPDDILGIPGFAEFDVSSYGKAFAVIGKDGLLVGDFLRKYVPFTIVLKYEGRSFTRQFTREEVSQQINIFERSLSLQSIPRVLRKTTAPRPEQEPLHPLLQPQSTPIPPGLLPLKPPPPSDLDITSKIPGTANDGPVSIPQSQFQK